MIQEVFWHFPFLPSTLFLPVKHTTIFTQHVSAPLHNSFAHVITFITRLSSWKLFFVLQVLSAMELLLWRLSFSPSRVGPLCPCTLLNYINIAAILLYMTTSCIRNITSLWTDSMYYSLTLIFDIMSGPFGLSVFYRTNNKTGFLLIWG